MVVTSEKTEMIHDYINIYLVLYQLVNIDFFLYNLKDTCIMKPILTNLLFLCSRTIYGDSKTQGVSTQMAIMKTICLFLLHICFLQVILLCCIFLFLTYSFQY